MDDFDRIWKFETQQFKIELAFGPEYDAPDWDFESEEERAELYEKINDGRLSWFCARVRVLWNGQEISADYLGGCCYESVEDFKRDGYFRDMVRTAISEARDYFKTIDLPKLRAA
jgi:hypothetical protein